MDKANRKITIEPSWKAALTGEFEAEYFKKLADFVRAEYKTNTVFPAPKNIFHAFDACPLDDVKVVIIGQDPYHGDGQANGLCFAVPERVVIPPSLQNIFKEISSELAIQPLASGDLTRWAKQGVLLLNATLTVRAHIAGSHQNKGWEEFTDAVISKLSQTKSHLVFLLWGNYARKKGAQIDRAKHLVLESAHPSPLSAYGSASRTNFDDLAQDSEASRSQANLVIPAGSSKFVRQGFDQNTEQSTKSGTERQSRGFFGNNHFSQTNDYLKKHNQKEIDWR